MNIEMKCMGTKGKDCDGILEAGTLDTPDERFVCRVLYCPECFKIVDKSWWSMPKMVSTDTLTNAVALNLTNERPLEDDE